jgi:thioesterase domain-containing protein
MNTTLTSEQERILSQELLVPIKRGGQGLPLFMAPAAGSTPLSLASLARSLERWQVVYAFTWPGLDTGICPCNTIEELADSYLSEIRAIQESGPYYLVGHCWGGSLIHEIAVMIESAGDTVAAVVLMDSFPPRLGKLENGKKVADERIPGLFKRIELNKSQKIADDYIREQIAGLPAKYAYQFERITNQLLAMTSSYCAMSCNVPIVLFRTATHHEVVYQDWKHLCAKGVVEHILPGDAYSMLSPPAVRVLAKKLEKAVGEPSSG